MYYAIRLYSTPKNVLLHFQKCCAKSTKVKIIDVTKCLKICALYWIFIAEKLTAAYGSSLFKLKEKVFLKSLTNIRTKCQEFLMVNLKFLITHTN